MQSIIIDVDNQIGNCLLQHLSWHNNVIGTSDISGSAYYLSSGDYSALDTLTPDVIFITKHKNNLNELIAEIASRYNPLIVFFSSDYVFPGIKGQYTEDDITGPICSIGSNFLQNEKIVRSYNKYLIVRTSHVFSLNADGNISTIISNCKQQKYTDASTTEIGNPTDVNDLIASTLDLVKRNINIKTIHVAGQTRCNRYEFAKLVAFKFGYNTNLIRPVQTTTINNGLDIALLKIICKIVPTTLDISLQKLKRSNIID